MSRVELLNGGWVAVYPDVPDTYMGSLADQVNMLPGFYNVAVDARLGTVGREAVRAAADPDGGDGDDRFDEFGGSREPEFPWQRYDDQPEQER